MVLSCQTYFIFAVNFNHSFYVVCFSLYLNIKMDRLLTKGNIQESPD